MALIPATCDQFCDRDANEPRQQDANRAHQGWYSSVIHRSG